MLSVTTAGCQCASGKRIGWEGWTRASLSKVICQSFSTSKVAFAASWTHKHDGNDMIWFCKVIIVVAGAGAYRQ
jgi:hypothetical protein